MHQRLLDLILYKTYAELKFEAQRTYVGVLWWIFEPIMFMLIFYFVFAVVFERGTENFVPFLLIGLTAFHWLQSTVTQASWAIISNRPLIQQVHVPKFVFPTVVVLSTTAKFAIVFCLLLIYLVVYGIPVAWEWLYSLVCLANMLLLTTGMAFLASSVTPFVPDIRILIDNGFRGLFFLSGIFYEISSLPPGLAEWLRLNPIALVIEDLRDALLYHQEPVWTNEATVALLGLSLGAIGLTVMHLNDHRYVKVTV